MSKTSTSPVKEELEASISRLKNLCSHRPLQELGTRAAQQLSVPLPAKLGRVRFADPDDCRPVFHLCTQPMREQFRINSPEDVLELINHSVCCVTQVDAAGQVVGFLSAREYPLLPAVHPCAWEEYVWNRYRALELRARNTLWLHLLCWSPRYGRELVDGMMRSLFLHDPHLHHIAFLKTIVTCMHLVPGASRSEASFKLVSAVERGIAGNRLPALMVAARRDVCPRLKVRRAVQADNDDILPMLEQHSGRLRQLYGQYYISELVAATAQGRSHRRVLVAEHNDQAVGVMILNAVLNLGALEECFELAPFAGLRHLDGPPQRHRYRLPPTAPPGTSQQDHFEYESEEQYHDEEAEHQTEEEENEEQHQLTEGGAGGGGEQEGPAADKRSHPHSHGNTNAVVQPLEDCRTARSVSAVHLGLGMGGLLDDDEEVEYDILNIDLDLLKVLHLQILPEPAASRRDSCDTDQSTETVQDILRPRRDKVKSKPSAPPSETPSEPPSEPAEFHLTRYSGPPNAFLLEVYAIHPDYDERYGFDMLEAAYEMFPERDYCVVCVPTHNHAFPLLEHFTLVAPHTTMNKRFINDSLFVAHVNSVRGEVSTRPCEQADLPHISELLEHAPNRAPLAHLIHQSLLRPSQAVHSHLLLAQQQPIGILIVGPLEHGTYVRNQFQLQPESRRLASDGVIIGGVMSPALDPHARFYLRDVMRWTRYVTLFWACQPCGGGEQSGRRNMMSLAQWMMPVQPQPQPRLPYLSLNPRLDTLYQIKFPFALWRMERPMTSVPMVYVTTSIVVVGASTTGLAFIEGLLTSPSCRHLTFSNVTLVSEHGLPTVSEPLEAAHTCVPQRGRYTHRYLRAAPFPLYIDVVAALVTAIDRKQKRVSLSTGGHVYYDELVLTCGLQYQHPDYLRSSLQQAAQLKVGNPCERTLFDSPAYLPERVPPAPRTPLNLYIINCLPQADRALRSLQAMMDARSEELTVSNPVVVYGACVGGYCCVSALLQLGVPPHHIGFVEPPPPPPPAPGSVFNNDLVDERVQSQMEQLGIRVVRGFRLLKAYTLRQRVASLCLMDRLRSLTVACFALFYYGHKAIDIQAFKAINECGLVYDGALVVGPRLCTNDPHIHAAGPCTRYARRLYAQRWNHQYYNSQDVGEALATIFLRKLDPFIAEHPGYKDADLPQMPRYHSSVYSQPHPSIADVRPSRHTSHLTQLKDTEAWHPVMQFRSGVTVRATLPGPLYYLRVRKPGPQVPMEVLLSLPHQGHTLETDCGGNYFRLRLNRLHCVEAVTCLSRRPFPARVYDQLYGKHEAYFNKLLLRFRTGRVGDLFEYFLQPWMAAMHQHSFHELTANLNYTHIGTMYEALRSRFVYEEERAAEGAGAGGGGGGGGGGGLGRDAAKDSNKSSHLMSCAEVDCLEEQDRIQFSFQSMISKLVMRPGTRRDVRIDAKQLSDLECGQSTRPHSEAAAMWRAVDGDSIVHRHLGAHLQRYRVPNPHYAPVSTHLHPHPHPHRGQGEGEGADDNIGDDDDGDEKQKKENEENKEGKNNKKDDDKERDSNKTEEKQDEDEDTDKNKAEDNNNGEEDKNQDKGYDNDDCHCHNGS